MQFNRVNLEIQRIIMRTKKLLDLVFNETQVALTLFYTENKICNKTAENFFFLLEIEKISIRAIRKLSHPFRDHVMGKKKKSSENHQNY